MRFLSTSATSNSLYHDALSLVGIPETDTTTFATATFTRYANAWYHRLVFYAWRSSSKWQFDDSNYTDFPEATTDLMVGYEDYSIPSTAIDVLECYVMNASGDYQKLTRINPYTLSGARDEYGETDGMPAEWYLEGNSIILKPAPAAGYVTLTDGLKAILDRDIDPFLTTDTIKEPGFPKMFHRIISLGAAFDFARAHDMGFQVNLLKPDLDKMTAEFEEYYSKRSRGDKKRIKPNLINSI